MLVIQKAFSIFQRGVMDRKNKAEVRKLFRQIEKLEGQSQAIDIYLKVSEYSSRTRGGTSKFRERNQALISLNLSKRGFGLASINKVFFRSIDIINKSNWTI